MKPLYLASSERRRSKHGGSERRARCPGCNRGWNRRFSGSNTKSELLRRVLRCRWASWLSLTSLLLRRTPDGPDLGGPLPEQMAQTSPRSEGTGRLLALPRLPSLPRQRRVPRARRLLSEGGSWCHGEKASLRVSQQSWRSAERAGR